MESQAYVVAVNFPEEFRKGTKFSCLQQNHFRVKASCTVGRIIQQLCHKYGAGEPSGFRLATMRGFLLEESHRFEEYGLGVLFLVWQVQLIPIQKLDEIASMLPLHVEVSLPPNPEFLGTERMSVSATPGSTVEETLAAVCANFQIDPTKHALQTSKGLSIRLSDRLENHGFCALHYRESGISLRLVNEPPLPVENDLELNRNRKDTRKNPPAYPSSTPELRKSAPDFNRISHTSEDASIQQVTSMLSTLTPQQLQIVHSFIGTLQTPLQKAQSDLVGPIYHQR